MPELLRGNPPGVNHTLLLLLNTLVSVLPTLLDQQSEFTYQYVAGGTGLKL